MVSDQVMAFFGAPFRPDDHEARAVKAALAIVSGVEVTGAKEDGLRVGGGVENAEVFTGNVGEEGVRDFTVIGDTVNTAAGLRQAADPGEVIVAEYTYQATSAEFAYSGQRTVEL